MWHIYLGAVTLGLSVLLINLLLNRRALHRLGSEKHRLPDGSYRVASLSFETSVGLARIERIE